MNWIERHTILKTVWGSRAFGTAGPDSDLDVRGVCIPPPRYLLGLSSFEQYEDRAGEVVIYGLAKFARLALANNPNMLDILWADEEDVLYVDDYGEALRAARGLFLSRRVAQTYAGYADDQLKRMETHYRWLHSPPDHQPTPPEFGAAPHPKGGFRFPDTQQERAYRAALKHWQNYQGWRANRHPQRAALEALHGYDTKHAAHLLRLYRMGIEILRQQVVRVRRPDAAWLREVLGGRYSYDELMALVADLRGDLAEAAAASALPAEPDAAAVEALVVNLHRASLVDPRFAGINDRCRNVPPYPSLKDVPAPIGHPQKD
jgi:predicted nucleotidyltransferase